MNTFRLNLSDYLIRSHQLQIIGQSIRQSIAKNNYFQVQTVFQRLDKFKKGYLIPSDFIQFMVDNKSYPKEEEIYILFRSFDFQRIGTITLDRFTQQILPQENIKMRKQALSRKFYIARERLEVDLQFLVHKYFDHKIKEHNQLQVIRNKLSQHYITYPQQAYSLIDKHRKIQIGQKQIDNYLRSNGKVLKPQQINRIFRVLSFRNNHLDFKLFLEHLSPFSQGFYIAYAERIIEKQKVHQKYLQNKLIIEGHKLQNSRREIAAKLQIQELRKSNRKFYEQVLKSDIESRIIEDRIRNSRYI